MSDLHFGGGNASVNYERVVVVFTAAEKSTSDVVFAAADEENEFCALVAAVGAQVVASLSSRRQLVDATNYLGLGKIQELAACCRTYHPDLVIINATLTPAQERNIEREIKCRVLDRVGLILAIFAARARSAVGKWQVELAQLQYMSTRLVRGWTHLERQKGGIGLRGPGETQLETDRRLIAVRIKQIQAKLQKNHQQRRAGRASRQKRGVLTVALVGYTNAGKSTLFHQLTGATVLQSAQVFATLDPTLRGVLWPGIGNIVVADTVGFIRNLPHQLVEAFAATLDETVHADVLIHVVDASDKLRREHMRAVQEVLRQVAADAVPQLVVFNKIDKTSRPQPRLLGKAGQRLPRVWLSATAADTSPLLQEALRLVLRRDIITATLCVDPSAAALRAKLYQRGGVLQDDSSDVTGSHLLTVSLHKHEWYAVEREWGTSLSSYKVMATDGIEH